MEEGFNLIEKQCMITASQLYTLSKTPFARCIADDDIEIDNDHDPDTWPQSSADGVTLSDDYNVVKITLRSPPLPNDVVSGVRNQLGFQLPDPIELVPDSIPTPIIDVEMTDIGTNSVNRPLNDVVSGDLGFQGGIVENGGDTQELIECDDDTEVITEEDDDDEDEVSMGRNSSEDATQCLLQVLRVLTHTQGNNKEEEKVVDFLQTAKRRGYTFPPPRWKLA